MTLQLFKNIRNDVIDLRRDLKEWCVRNYKTCLITWLSVSSITQFNFVWIIAHLLQRQ